MTRSISMLATAALAAMLGACGGGGGGGRVAALPPPPVTPTPTPSAGPLKTAPFGVTGTAEFSTTSASLGIRWNAGLQAYEVTFRSPDCDGDALIGCPVGKIVPSAPGSNFGTVVADDGTVLSNFASVSKDPYSYTSWGMVGPAFVAFGLPTLAGAAPKTGSASYDAEIHGAATAPAYEYTVGGSALFQFDFAAGTLSGHMDPELNGPMGGPILPRYTFTQTVYSVGGTTFSGSFDVTGTTPSLFQGRFTGPVAQELMAAFQAPISINGDAGIMNGIMIGKKKP